MGTLEETTLTVPLLPVRDIEVMFIEKASIQSAGESPMFTWMAVLAAGVGDGLGTALELLLHALNAMVITSDRQTATTLSNL
jgi:hypothetical protein